MPTPRNLSSEPTDSEMPNTGQSDSSVERAIASLSDDETVKELLAAGRLEGALIVALGISASTHVGQLGQIRVLNRNHHQSVVEGDAQASTLANERSVIAEALERGATLEYAANLMVRPFDNAPGEPLYNPRIPQGPLTLVEEAVVDPEFARAHMLGHFGDLSPRFVH